MEFTVHPWGEIYERFVQSHKEINIDEKLSVLQPAKYDRISPTNIERKKDEILKLIKTIRARR